MASNGADDLAQTYRLINQLQTPITDLSTLLSLLSAPLDCLALLPPRFLRYNTSPLPPNSLQISRHIPVIQRALLDHVVPSWKSMLDEESATILIDQFFVPDAFMNRSSSAGIVALYAYSTILARPSGDYALSLLERLSSSYPIDRLHTAIFKDTQTVSHVQSIRLWEDCVRNVLSVPARVANALEGKNVPTELEQGRYFHKLVIRCEELLLAVSQRGSTSSMLCYI
jgi:telomere length regulation protein